MTTHATEEFSVEVVESKLFAGAAADEIITSLNEAISERGRATVVLSGGSTPGAIYRLMALPPRVDEVEWGKVVLYWGDERWVPHDDNQSNFRMVQETLLSQLGGRMPEVVAVDTSGSSPDKGAEVYSATIMKNEKVRDGELPEFDLMLLGMGEDGHTASIFPGSPLIEQSGGVCFAAKHPTDGTQRVTMSPDTIFAARHILFLVKGENKAHILQEVLEGGAPPSKYPAALFRKAAPRVSWFLDSGAATKLEMLRK